MARVSPRVPAADDLLCEKCGYVLNGLPMDSRCPECGTLIRESLGEHRHLPAWERPCGAPIRDFLTTSAEMMFRPTYFYRTLAVRGSVPRARRFAQVQWWVAGFFFAVAAAVHGSMFFSVVSGLPLPSWRLFSGRALPAGYDRAIAVVAGLIVLLTPASYVIMDLFTRLAAWLSAWEAGYRGLRLPYPIVLRGMYYHAALLFPVAVVAAVTVVGYQVLLASLVVDSSSVDRYLYLLCAEVVLAAVYLFTVYWIGMRNMMYANR